VESDTIVVSTPLVVSLIVQVLKSDTIVVSTPLVVSLIVQVLKLTQVADRTWNGACQLIEGKPLHGFADSANASNTTSTEVTYTVVELPLRNKHRRAKKHQQQAQPRTLCVQVLHVSSGLVPSELSFLCSAGSTPPPTSALEEEEGEEEGEGEEELGQKRSCSDSQTDPGLTATTTARLQLVVGSGVGRTRTHSGAQLRSQSPHPRTARLPVAVGFA
jgi:hypothetical protein